LAEEVAELVREQRAIVIRLAQQPSLDGQVFGLVQRMCLNRKNWIA
jgi:hypothetical protein